MEEGVSSGREACAVRRERRKISKYERIFFCFYCDKTFASSLLFHPPSVFLISELYSLENDQCWILSKF